MSDSIESLLLLQAAQAAQIDENKRFGIRLCLRWMRKGSEGVAQTVARNKTLHQQFEFTNPESNRTTKHCLNCSACYVSSSLRTEEQAPPICCGIFDRCILSDTGMPWRWHGMAAWPQLEEPSLDVDLANAPKRCLTRVKRPCGGINTSLQTGLPIRVVLGSRPRLSLSSFASRQRPPQPCKTSPDRSGTLHLRCRPLAWGVEQVLHLQTCNVAEVVIRT